MEKLGSKLIEEYKVDASEVITFKLVYNESDINNKIGFHPEFTHQIFGESERIFGYRDLKINIYYGLGLLSTFIDISYSSIIDSKISVGAKADDIMASLSNVYEYEIIRKLPDFINILQKEKEFIPHGDNTRKFCINFIEYGMPDFEQFLEYHKRMESFLLFFIDGASSIDTNDQQCYEKLEQIDEAFPIYTFIGYMTVYKFYAYPTNLRPRVSQIIVLPPFRNNGHATQLLQTFYQDFVPISNVVDITAEDPSEDFQRVRNFLDCKRCLEMDDLMDIFKQDKENNAITFRNMARQKLKLNRSQSKRVYEILMLYLLPRSNNSYKAFENALTKRITTFFKRVRPNAMRGSSLVPKAGSSTNLNNLQKTFDDVEDECFYNQLQEEVQFLLKSYQETVLKLDRAKLNVQ